jgi:hypothetical protein
LGGGGNMKFVYYINYWYVFFMHKFIG